MYPIGPGGIVKFSRNKCVITVAKKGPALFAVLILIHLADVTFEVLATQVQRSSAVVNIPSSPTLPLCIINPTSNSDGICKLEYLCINRYNSDLIGNWGG